MTLVSLSHRIVLSFGLRRCVLAFAMGALSALSMPPVSAFPMLFLTLPAAVWLLDGAGMAGRRMASARIAAVIGWCFGFGYFLGGLWWIGAAFLVDAKDFAWMMPFAVVGLPMGLALFHALGFALARLMWSSGPWRIWAFAAGLGAAELLRGHVLSGFPWNSFGYAIADNQVLGQIASVIGMEGLIPLSLAIFAAPATLIDDETYLRWRPTLMALASLAGLAVFGGLRLANAHLDYFPQAVRLVQPAIPQDDKFRPEEKDAIMARYLSLSDEASSPQRTGVADVDLLIWPESAFPFFLSRTPDALAAIADLLPEKTTLITGAARIEATNDERKPRVTNAMQALDGNGTITASYDKIHLVPFGEFLPFQSVLESLGVTQLTKLPGGFSPGDRRRTLELPGGLRIAPLICYEAIFPNDVVEESARPDMLLNLTNDAWFGRTAGPYQHFAQARVRAVEQGISLIRVANTGISGVIDPYGRMLNHLDLGVAGIIDVSVPKPLPPTLYTRYRLSLVVIIYLAAFGLGLFGFRRV